MAETKEAAESLRKAKATFAPTPTEPSPAPVETGAEPVRFLRRFAREMDRLFEDLGLDRHRHFHAPRLLGRRFFGHAHEMLRADWHPQIDVFEKQGQLIIRADLPGLGKDEVKVDISDDTLTIQGERKVDHEEKRAGYCYCERAHGSFVRAIPLPEGAETARASATFRYGVLEVTIPAPRLAEIRGRRLEVKG